jgi:cation:H+ antiporter
MPQDSWIFLIAYLLVGFALLARGAGWLVGGSSQIARRFGVSILVVGLTVVAFGTSMPEIVVSGVAATQGNVALSLGNVLGSNIANIGLVLGASAMVLPAVLQSKLAPREVLWLFTSLAVLWWFAGDGAISRSEAAVFLGVFTAYNVHVFATARRGATTAIDELTEAADELEEKVLKRPWLTLAIGIVAISLGGYLAVLGAEGAAIQLGMPQAVAGLTIAAIGTSLPELAAGLGGAFKGDSDISIGNVVGSNVFNLLAVIGIVGIIQPLDPAHPNVGNPTGVEEAFAQALSEDLWVVLAFSLFAVLLPYIAHGRAGRTKGAALLAAYVIYTAWLFVSRT